MTVIDELRDIGVQIREQALPATVRIGRGWGRGAGFVLSDGFVVTNSHHLRGAETTVSFSDGRSAAGRVAGVDPDGDLVVLAVDTAGARPLGWAAEASRAAGSPVWAPTVPAGTEGRVTFGFVSAVNRPFRGPGGRTITGGLEHTAPLARGSSGGPVVDAQGQLVGINTHRMGEGFYLAITADDSLRSRLDALAAGQSTRRRHLGVALAPGHAARRLRDAVGLPARDGLLIRAVEEGSPAARGGLQRGDLIVSAGGSAISNPDDLYAALAEPVDRLVLMVVRGVEEVEVTVSLVDEESPDTGPASA